MDPETQVIDTVNEFLVSTLVKAIINPPVHRASFNSQKVDSIDEAFVSVIVFKANGEEKRATNFTNDLGK